MMMLQWMHIILNFYWSAYGFSFSHPFVLLNIFMTLAYSWMKCTCTEPCNIFMQYSLKQSSHQIWNETSYFCALLRRSFYLFFKWCRILWCHNFISSVLFYGLNHDFDTTFITWQKPIDHVLQIKNWTFIMMCSKIYPVGCCCTPMFSDIGTACTILYMCPKCSIWFQSSIDRQCERSDPQCRESQLLAGCSCRREDINNWQERKAFHKLPPCSPRGKVCFL